MLRLRLAARSSYRLENFTLVYLHLLQEAAKTLKLEHMCACQSKKLHLRRRKLAVLHTLRRIRLLRARSVVVAGSRVVTEENRCQITKST